ncbi:MAG: DNA polymerase [Mycobacteriales bacterium]
MGLAWSDESIVVLDATLADVILSLEHLGPRWVWWSARDTAVAVVASGVRPRTCWDLSAVSRMLDGIRREDPPAVWAATLQLAGPVPLPTGDPDLLDLAAEADRSGVDADHRLPNDWAGRAWRRDPDAVAAWAERALQCAELQWQRLERVPDPRAAPGQPPLAVVTAQAESAAALLAIELEHDGLPLDRHVAGELLTRFAAPRAQDATAEHRLRRARDAVVLQHFPGESVDLRNPAQVRELLARIGLDLPDTRSWRLLPHAATLPAVAALLSWRKAERLLTTFGWTWLDMHVGPDGRLRGTWGAADAAAGRMTAQSGLHNLPAELRPAVRAEEGFVFVRADLGQIEPRVLAVVSGDPGLAAAAGEADMYAPVAAALGCDRPTAKIAVLAAMYGQTSGTAGAALRDMDRTYPIAMAYLRDAEAAGSAHRDTRTYGGRLLPVSRVRQRDAEPLGEHVAVSGGLGRFVRNAVVQGAAAELFKAWAATVRHGLLGTSGQIVLCLHDELLVHVPKQQAPDCARLLDDALQSVSSWWAAGSGVRFVAEVGVGASWPEASA